MAWFDRNFSYLAIIIRLNFTEILNWTFSKLQRIFQHIWRGDVIKCEAWSEHEATFLAMLNQINEKWYLKVIKFTQMNAENLVALATICIRYETALPLTIKDAWWSLTYILPIFRSRFFIGQSWIDKCCTSGTVVNKVCLEMRKKTYVNLAKQVSKKEACKRMYLTVNWRRYVDIIYK